MVFRRPFEVIVITPDTSSESGVATDAAFAYLCNYRSFESVSQKQEKSNENLLLLYTIKCAYITIVQKLLKTVLSTSRPQGTGPLNFLSRQFSSLFDTCFFYFVVFPCLNQLHLVLQKALRSLETKHILFVLIRLFDGDIGTAFIPMRKKPHLLVQQVIAKTSMHLIGLLCKGNSSF